jgi:26S proteasome regulatory subunit N12
LEAAVIFSLRKDNIEEFEANMIQLRAFYSECKTVLTTSPNKYGLIGLYLLFLIYKNRTADYYTELELLTLEEQKNQCIAVALALEQHFVDGNYYQVLHTKQSLPLDIYGYFINKMVDTVQHEAARSAEKAFKQLKVQDAYKVFLLANPGDLEPFVEKQKQKGLENNVAWVLHNGYIHFEAVEKEKLTIPAHRVVNQSLQFAHELEKIV